MRRLAVLLMMTGTLSGCFMVGGVIGGAATNHANARKPPAEHSSVAGGVVMGMFAGAVVDALVIYSFTVGCTACGE